MHMPHSLFDDPEDLMDAEDADEVTFEDDHPPPPDEEDDDQPVRKPPTNGANGHAKIGALADAKPDDPQRYAPVPDDAPPPVTKYAKMSDLLLEYKHWTNPRTITGLDDAKLTELAQSIKARTIHGAGDGQATIVGLTDAMKVVAIDNNGRIDLLIYDGQRRFLATTKVFGEPGDELVPVIWRYPEPVAWTPELAHEVFVEAVHGVGTREGLSAFELSEIAVRLRSGNDPRTKKQTTLAQIAKDLNRSESWVSKILTAREAASPSLLAKWRRGEITEEVFRDLAVVKDKGAQAAKADEIASAKGRGEARHLAKAEKLVARKEEKAEKASAKPAKPAPAPKGPKGGKGKPVVRGQAELPAVAAPEPPKAKPMPRAVIDDILHTQEGHPPTHDLVKGVILGIRVAAGLLDTAQLPKPWHQYLDKVMRAKEAKGNKQRR